MRWISRQRRTGNTSARALAALVVLSVSPTVRLSAQGDVDRLALRFASMTAVTGLEQAMTDSLLALLPGSVRDRAGNVTVTLGRGAPRRLVTCGLDEVGYVVGNVRDDGLLTLRRVGAPPAEYPIFDQQLEGHRVTLFGSRGAVPGVVAVRSVHLTRGRVGPTTPDPPFTVDNAYVDVGATSAAQVKALGLAVLAPVALAKRPTVYGEGERLLAASFAGRRAACAALAAAALAKPTVRGTVVAAFTVQSLLGDAGAKAVERLAGPFDDTHTAVLSVRYPGTAVETVSLAAADSLRQALVAWMEGR